jgi:hypothetical protein
MTTKAWDRTVERIQAGLCRACGLERGEDGTKQHCRHCADTHNARRRKDARPTSCGLCLELRPLTEFRVRTRSDGSERRAVICKRCEAVSRRVRLAGRRKRGHTPRGAETEPAS